MSALTEARARHSAYKRHRSANDPEVLKSKAELHAAKTEAAIARAVAEAPPLTDEQAGRIVRLLFAAAPAPSTRAEVKAA